MAKVYFDKHYRTTRPIMPPQQIGLPAGSLKTRLSCTSPQGLIPFLGAGASLARTADRSIPEPSQRPTSQQLDAICADFNVGSPAGRRFVEVALQLAQLVDKAPPPPSDNSPQFAPSSWHLAMRLAEMIAIEPLRPIAETLRGLLDERPVRSDDDYLQIVRDVANLMGLSASTPQLLSVASCFNHGDDRDRLRRALRSRFAEVSEVTPIQRRIAEYAKRFVKAQNSDTTQSLKRDYVIVTTNYDPLMEHYLDKSGVPTCVVTVDRRSRVHVDFMPNVQSLLGLDSEQFAGLTQIYREGDQAATVRTAKKFAFEMKPYSLAMIYKIHGCPVIHDVDKVDDIVISDRDYVLFIQNNGRTNELVPAYVQHQAVVSGFLFLGYSFSDWNVRGLYHQFLGSRQARTPQGDETESWAAGNRIVDYVATRTFNDDDQYFWQNYDASILVTELDDLAAQLD